MQIPLNSGDSQDLSVTAGSLIGIMVSYREMILINGAYQWGQAWDAWPASINPFDASTYAILQLAAGR